MRLNNLSVKTNVFVIAVLLLFSSCHTSKKKSSTFELKGDLAQAGEGIKVYLDRLAPNDTIEHLDSTTIDKGGNFVLNTDGIYKGFYTIRIGKGDFATLILDSNEKVLLTGNAQNLGYTYNISGSPDSKLFWEYNMKSKIHMMQLDSMEHLFDAKVNSLHNDKQKLDSLSNTFERPFDSILDYYQVYLKNFIRTNISSFTCMPATQELNPFKDEDYYYSLDSGLMSRYPNSVYVKLFHTKTGLMKKTKIGINAPDLSLADTSGKMQSLADYRGKYVLIDFWASWCRPCKESLPGLIDVFDKYKDKNFTVFSVSIDDKRIAWLDAIHYFKLPWILTSDLKGWNSPVVNLYGFDGIPFSVLISPEGKILAKGLNDSELDKKLQELLK